MTDITERLQAAIAAGEAEPTLLSDALQEIRELRKQRDALEEILIVLARTQLPFDEEGNQNDGAAHFKERYQNAMREAAGLLGLDIRSTITRTEPKT